MTEVFTTIGVLLTIIIGFYQFQKRNSLKFITAQRQEWRKSIGDICANIGFMNLDDSKKELSKLIPLLNGYGYINSNNEENIINDRHIITLIEEVMTHNEESDITKQLIQKVQKHLSLLLKFEWEKAKNEIHGNSYSFIINLSLLSLSIFNTVVLSIGFSSIFLNDVVIMFLIALPYFAIVFNLLAKYAFVTLDEKINKKSNKLLKCILLELIALLRMIPSIIFFILYVVIYIEYAGVMQFELVLILIFILLINVDNIAFNKFKFKTKNQYIKYVEVILNEDKVSNKEENM